MICVYPADCTDFSTNGNGTIEPTSALVTETLNGEYELQLVHPIDEAGKWQRLVEGCILRAPVPAATTPRVHFFAPGDDSGTEIYRIHTDFPGAETRKGTLYLRSGPGRNYKILAAYKNTLTVQVIAKTSDSWYEVTAPDGKHGYMDTTYLVYDHTEGSASEAVSSVVEERQLRDQPFRIYRIVPELDQITVYARHVFYDLLDNMIKSYKPSPSAVGASVVQTVSSSCLSEHDFTFYSDLDSTAENVEFENVNPVDAILGEDGVVKKYAGELTRDWWDVFVVKRVGQDSNVQIRQAKNLLGISYDIDLTDVVTRIMPIGEDADGNVLYLPELYIDSPLIDTYTHPKWIHLPVSEAKEDTDGDDAKTKEECYFFAQHEPHHLCIIEKNSRNGKDRSYLKRQIVQAMQIAAVLIVCLTVAGVTAVASSSHLRVQIMQLLARTTPNYTELSLSVEKEIDIPSEWQGTYYPGAVPERSVISFMDSNNKISWVCFSDEESDGKWKVSFTEYDEATDVRIDSENANQVESLINGHEVTILEKEGLITVYWNDGQRLLVLQTQRCSLSETITYASNVVMIK